MLVITAPNEVYSPQNNSNIKMFMAGGITNCPDWQSDLIKMLDKINRDRKEGMFQNLTLYNPRRENFPINDLKASEVQITWEYEHLKSADMIGFWFAKGSLNPIVLYELGMWGNSSRVPIIVGVDRAYERINDVYIQTKLARPYTKLVFTLEEFALQVKEIYHSFTS